MQNVEKYPEKGLKKASFYGKIVQNAQKNRFSIFGIGIFKKWKIRLQKWKNLIKSAIFRGETQNA